MYYIKPQHKQWQVEFYPQTKSILFVLDERFFAINLNNSVFSVSHKEGINEIVIEIENSKRYSIDTDHLSFEDIETIIQTTLNWQRDILKNHCFNIHEDCN